MSDHFTVSRMIDPITGWNHRDVERIDTLEAPDVVPVLLWIGAPPVMRVNAADVAKIMLGGVRVELVDLQMLGTFDDVEPA